MGREIERKFLVNIDLDVHDLEGEIIYQGYIKSDGAAIRARTKGDKGFITVKKSLSNITNLEYEYEIPYNDAVEMIENVCYGYIKKKRFCIPRGPHIWEVDFFMDYYDGLVVAEIELSSEDEEFEAPSWLGQEVTNDPQYRNVNMCFKQGDDDG